MKKLIMFFQIIILVTQLSAQSHQYFWTLTEKPLGSSLNQYKLFKDNDHSTIRFSPDKPGKYIIHLAVRENNRIIDEQDFRYQISSGDIYKTINITPVSSQPDYTNTINNNLPFESGDFRLWFEKNPKKENQLANLIEISWESNKRNIEYRYKIDMPGDWTGGIRYAYQKWSDWGNYTSIQYKKFIIDGKYTFVVEARDRNTNKKIRKSIDFNVNFVMPEIYDKGINIDWNKVNAQNSQKKKYKVLSQEYRDAYRIWSQIYESERRILNISYSGDKIINDISGEIVGKGQDLLLNWADKKIAASLSRILWPKLLYDIVKQAGLDFVLIYQNIKTNEAAFKMVTCYWAAESYQRLGEYIKKDQENIIRQTIFFDDFSERNISDWSFYKYSTGLHGFVNNPKITNSRVEITTRDQQNTLFVNGNVDWTNYTLEYDVKIERSLDDAYKGIYTNFYIDNLEYSSDGIFRWDAYLFNLKGRDNTWKLIRVFSSPNIKSNIIDQGRTKISVGVDYHIKIINDKNQISIYFNKLGESENLLTSIMVDNRNILHRGKFGIGGSDDKISIDNVKLTY